MNSAPSRLSFFHARQWTNFISMLYEFVYHDLSSLHNGSHNSSGRDEQSLCKCDLIEMKIEMFIMI